MIANTVLVLAGPFSSRLDAQQVSAAISRGMSAEGHLECDVCPLDYDLGAGAPERSKLLDEHDFDLRMRAARAVVLACAQLDDRTLANSVVFEAATRARQAGVPAYALTGRDALDPFEARIVDLQVILEASTPRALSAAARKLAMLV